MPFNTFLYIFYANIVVVLTLINDTGINIDNANKTNLEKNENSSTLRELNNLVSTLTNNNKNLTHFVTTINEVINEMESTESVNNTGKVNHVKYFEDFIKELEEEQKKFNEVIQGNDINITLREYLKKRTSDFKNPLNASWFHDSDSEEWVAPDDDSEIWVPNNRRIFRGRRTKIKHFPFMATVHIFGRFTCAGSIIKSDLVITASSCLQLAWNNRFFRENPRFLTVRVGSTFYIAGGESIPVFEVYFHPNYDPKTLKHNLAIMRLTRHIKFNRDNRNKVKKIVIDDNDNQLPFNTDGVLVLGWGSRTRAGKTNNPWIDRLSYSILDFYDLTSCQEVYSSRYVTMKNFCAGFISKGAGACNRDVGAPGIVHGKLVGVVSFGSPVCGTPDAPTVFTKVGFYADWIYDIMNQNVPYKKKSTTLEIPRTWKIVKFPTTRRTFKPITRIITKEPDEFNNEIDDYSSDEHSNLRTNNTIEIDSESTTILSVKSNPITEKSESNGYLVEFAIDYAKQLDKHGKDKSTTKKTFVETPVPKTVTYRGPTVGIEELNGEIIHPTVGLSGFAEDSDESFDAVLRSRVNNPNLLNLEVESHGTDPAELTDDIYDETLNLLDSFEDFLSNANDNQSYDGLSIEPF